MTSTWQQRVRFALPVLVAYGVILVAATHAPAEGDAFLTEPFDKLAHTLAYFLLAFLAAFVVSGFCRLPLAWYVGLLVGVAVYGGLDELTQPWFHRHCELRDWLADIFGAALGLAFQAVVSSVCSSLSETRASSASGSETGFH